MTIDHDHYDDTWLRDILVRTRTIAVVGASANPSRPSFHVMRTLRASGYAVVAVNPGLAPDAIPGVATVPGLSALPGPVDMIDVFRKSEAAGAVVDEVIALQPRPKVIWMQLGVRDDAAAARAEAAGIAVVMDRCPVIEWARLLGHPPISAGSERSPENR